MFILRNEEGLQLHEVKPDGTCVSHQYWDAITFKTREEAMFVARGLKTDFTYTPEEV